MVNANAIFFYGPIEHYAMIHKEFFLQTNSEIIFLINRNASIGDQATIKDIKNNDVLLQTQAVINDTIYALDLIAWYITSSGLTSAITMIEDMNQYLKHVGQEIEIPSLND